MKRLYILLLLIAPLFAFGQDLITAKEVKTIEKKGFKMYPNPAYGDVIHITTELNGTKEIQVFDVFGDVVLKDKITASTFNISRLVPGVYMLQVTERKRKMTRKLVVK